MIQCLIREKPPISVLFSIPSSKARRFQFLHSLPDAIFYLCYSSHPGRGPICPAEEDAGRDSDRDCSALAEAMERRARRAQLGAVTHGPPDLNASTPQASQQHESQEGKPPALGSRASLREALLIAKTEGTMPAGAWSPPGARPNQRPRKHLIV